MLKRTPLFATHQRLGGKLIEFGGWEMPVQYSSIVDEHLAVRKGAGLFDISHMGEVEVSGAEALSFLNQTLTNDVRKLAVGEGQYTLMCNPGGGVIDDLYLYRTAEKKFFLIINASRIENDVPWLIKKAKAFGNAVVVNDVSSRMGAVAVQGPKVPEFIDAAIAGQSLAGTSVTRASDLEKNQIAQFRFGTGDVWVARTGYTGEPGFEIVADNETMTPLWDKLFEAGKPFGLKPAGLGARDTLRTEMCYPLYGHELDEATTPLEAGIGFFVNLDKGDFVGRSILAGQKENGVRKKLVAFKMTEKSAPPRPGYPIHSMTPDSAPLGIVASGTQSPTLGIGIGLGYLPTDLAKVGTAIGIEIRGRIAPAVVVAKPIYKPT